MLRVLGLPSTQQGPYSLGTFCPVGAYSFFLKAGGLPLTRREDSPPSKCWSSLPQAPSGNNGWELECPILDPSPSGRDSPREVLCHPRAPGGLAPVPPAEVCSLPPAILIALPVSFHFLDSLPREAAANC